VKQEVGSMKERREMSIVSRDVIYTVEREGSELGLPPPSVLSDNQNYQM
jgi:hypothetical protein